MPEQKRPRRYKKRSIPAKQPERINQEVSSLQDREVIPEFPLAIPDKEDNNSEQALREIGFDLFMAGVNITDIAKKLNRSRTTIYKISKIDRWEDRMMEHCEEARRVISRMTPAEMEKYVPKLVNWVKILNLLMQKGYEFFRGEEEEKKKQKKKNPFENSNEALTGLKFVSSELQRLGFFAPEVLHIKSESKVETKASIDINLITKEEMNLLWECYEYAPDTKEAPAGVIIEQEGTN